MASFRYRALTQNGEVVSGSITAPTAAEVAHRIEYLGLIPIETVNDDGRRAGSGWNLSFLSAPRPEDVTFFTGDLALLLKTGARINDALALFTDDSDIGRLRPTIAKITAAIMAGESFADALTHHPSLFSPMYIALVRVGEASSTLANILEVLAAERVRAEALRRRFSDALRYPAFVLAAASAVLIFFLTFVLPQFATVLRDFNAKLDPIVLGFLGLSDFLHAHMQALAVALVVLVGGGWYVLSQPTVRGSIMEALARLPLVSRVMSFHRTSLFCRNLGVLLGAGVALTTTLRILADMMATTGRSPAWSKTGDLVRHGGKLSDALAETKAVPAMAIRTLRLGEESGQLPMLAERIAEFYEAKLQRSLDRLVGVIGPVAIVGISIIVGGLIVSVMTALMSVSQVVG
ncbi:type II secretion system F family protein [Methylocapsa polymorpha]|uniref:Type II secretion system F family protein n=1 Tax=Methylocapsa polymorpha TaxID=3080828 RepID=A0ABZ0HTC1_9HYPH|nr:type II secretion system F family protein [Methylocapsa sp. RX1]